MAALREDQARVDCATKPASLSSAPANWVSIAESARLAFDELDLGEMNLQLIANEENQDRAPSVEKNEAGGMIAFVFGAQKHVGNAAAEDRSDDAEHDRPEDRYAARSSPISR
jgi:uncharacterized cupredoxin-like copper-binding protein